jgi:uncharacterized protein (TIGR02246 family)
MTTESGRAAAETEIRDLVDGWVEAIRAGDVDARVASYAPDVLSFDAVNPLQRVGSDAVRERLEVWLSAYRGPVGYELRDLRVTAADDVAFCHSLNHITGTLKEGGDVDMWVRTTVGFRKVDGRWIVTHEHTSSPFDLETGKASVDLQP